MTNLSKPVALAAGLFLVAWPIFAIATGIGPLILFLVWFAAAILVGAAASGGIGAQPKTMTVPVFGALTTKNWKKGAPSYWSGKTNVAEASSSIEVWVYCNDAGPSDAQKILFETVRRDMSHLKTSAINELRALDRSEWPEAARDGNLELIAIELEDEEDTREGIFTLRFESPADPEADYYVDFRDGAVEEAYRVG